MQPGNLNAATANYKGLTHVITVWAVEGTPGD